MRMDIPCPEPEYPMLMKWPAERHGPMPRDNHGFHLWGSVHVQYDVRIAEGVYFREEEDFDLYDHDNDYISGHCRVSPRRFEQWYLYSNVDFIPLATKNGNYDEALDALQQLIHKRIDTGYYGLDKKEVAPFPEPERRLSQYGSHHY